MGITTRPPIYQVPNPEPPGYSIIRNMMQNRMMQRYANPYGMSPGGQGGWQGFNTGQVNPMYGGGRFSPQSQGGYQQPYGGNYGSTGAYNPGQPGPMYGGGGQVTPPGGGFFGQYNGGMYAPQYGGGINPYGGGQGPGGDPYGWGRFQPGGAGMGPVGGGRMDIGMQPGGYQDPNAYSKNSGGGGDGLPSWFNRIRQIQFHPPATPQDPNGDYNRGNPMTTMPGPTGGGLNAPNTPPPTDGMYGPNNPPPQTADVSRGQVMQPRAANYDNPVPQHTTQQMYDGQPQMGQAGQMNPYLMQLMRMLSQQQQGQGQGGPQ